MTTTLMPPISRTDAELIAASRGGNREAFGQIVRKYQSMVSGLIYAACGDLHRSEDLAQETFIAAWKSLSGLRDPSRLPGWLCQIARHRIADQFHESSTRKAQLQNGMKQEDSAGEEPLSQAMLAEENEILWRTLSRIAQPYRETLVLYYRQGQSTADVAAAMETTDASVRQRLTRGRQMLREELAAVLERNLVRSAPGEEFSLAVVAALPTAAAAGATATATAAAKGSAAAKSGLAFYLTVWVAPLLAAVSLLTVTVQSVRYAGDAKSRRFIVGYWVAFWGVIVVWVWALNKLVSFGHERQWDYDTFVPALSAMGCVYGMSLFGLMAWASVRGPIRSQMGHEASPLRKFWLRFLFLAPLIYCGIGWLVDLSLRGQDRFSANVIAGCAIAGSALCAWRGNDEKLSQNPIKMAFESWTLMVVIILLALDVRLRPWIAVTSHLNLDDLQGRISLWSINLFGALLILWMCLLAQRVRSSRTHLGPG